MSDGQNTRSDPAVFATIQTTRDGNFITRNSSVSGILNREENEPLIIKASSCALAGKSSLSYRIRCMYPFKVVLVGCSEPLIKILNPELVAQDAQIEVGFPNVEAAIEGLKIKRTAATTATASDLKTNSTGATKQPNLSQLESPAIETFLFLVYLASPPDFSLLRRLSGAFVGHPIIAIFADDQQPMLPIAAMRAGASQVVLTPLQREDFRSALNCIALQNGYGKSGGKTIAIAGVTGGCGATTIAINLAYELAHLRRKRTILAELSFQVGKLPVYLDVEPKVTNHDLIRDIRKMDIYQVQSALSQINPYFSVLTGPYEVVSPLTLSMTDLFMLTDYLKQLAEVVVLDVPCTYDHLYFETLAAADQVVLVGEQKVPSIRSLQMINGNLANKRPHLLLNRYDPHIRGFGVQRIKELLQVPDLLTITNDYEAVSTAINHGQPLRVASPRSRVLTDIDQLASTLLPQSSSLFDASGPGMFNGLMRALGWRT